MKTAPPMNSWYAGTWQHWRNAPWPWLPLMLAVLLCAVRFGGAPWYAYWNGWLTCFTALLTGYTAAATLRIVLQSLCFGNTLAYWIVAAISVVVCWPFANSMALELGRTGVPTEPFGLPLMFALLASTLLILPTEIAAERARWQERAARLAGQRQRQQELERQLLEARLIALQRQIEPHFLYNTLSNARALIRQDAAAAEQLLQHLIHFLRAAMPDLRSPSATLDEELARVRTYLEIIKMRMGERLHVEITASSEALACRLPPLAVLTLVENAIAHGLEAKVGGGSIHISAICVDQRLRMEVQDDGVGFQSELGSGVGLANLQARLEALHGDAAQLVLEPGAGGSGVCARIELPAITCDTA